MSDRPKMPKYIVVLNIIMIVIILVICGLVFALTWSSKDQIGRASCRERV